MPTYEGRPIEGSVAKPVYIAGLAGPLVDVDDVGIRTIDVFHSKIHEGAAFLISYKSPDANPVADNGTVVVFINPDREIHVDFVAAAGGDAQLELLENPTVANGTPLSAFNLNRMKVDDAGIVALLNPTVSNSGTVLLDIFLPGGTGPQASGAVAGLRTGTEIEFNPDRTYAVRITNRAGTNQPMSLALEYYSI